MRREWATTREVGETPSRSSLKYRFWTSRATERERDRERVRHGLFRHLCQVYKPGRVHARRGAKQRADVLTVVATRESARALTAHRPLGAIVVFRISRLLASVCAPPLRSMRVICGAPSLVADEKKSHDRATTTCVLDIFSRFLAADRVYISGFSEFWIDLNGRA